MILSLCCCSVAWKERNSSVPSVTRVIAAPVTGVVCVLELVTMSTEGVVIVAGALVTVVIAGVGVDVAICVDAVDDVDVTKVEVVAVGADVDVVTAAVVVVDERDDVLVDDAVVVDDTDDVAIVGVDDVVDVVVDKVASEADVLTILMIAVRCWLGFCCMEVDVSWSPSSSSSCAMSCIPSAPSVST